MSTPLPQTIAQHFEGKGKEVRATYDRIMAIAREWGDVKPEAKKTSIHLLRTATAFAGIATRKTALILTLKSSSDITNKRIARREQASANRWHLEIKLDSPEQVDKEIVAWLKKAYELAG